MAFSLTASGVLMTKGRGANAIRLELSFRAIETWAKQANKDRAELWRLSYGRACSGLKKKFFQVLSSGGGVNGVPKFKDFEDFTKDLRARAGRTAKMGGMLADRGSVVAFKRNGGQVIGWPDYLESPATAFQEGRGGPKAEKYFTDPEYRRAWHKQGLRDIPRAYVHNEREVIVPYFVDYVKTNLDEWAKANYFTGLAKIMQGKRDRQFERANLK